MSMLWYTVNPVRMYEVCQDYTYPRWIEKQILVVDSSEMFVDFVGTVARVAEWAGLPQHDFEYDQHEFSGTCSSDSRRRHRPDFFADGGRYNKKRCGV